MKIPGRLAVCTLLLAVPALVLAVQPGNSPVPPNAGAAATGTIERGGTVDAVDLRKQAIVVEGVAYILPVGSVKIHWPSNRVSGQLSELKGGMQIRFNSTTDSSSKQKQVREIWVTGSGPSR